MKVLIATDGSNFSHEAIRKCREIINKEALVIKIISVYEPVAMVATEPFMISSDYVSEMSNALKEETDHHVAGAAKIVKNLFAGNKIDLTTSVEMGIPEQVIIETAREWQADLIVVGSHGRGFWGRAMIGSTSDGIIHNAPCPVLVVKKSESTPVKTTSGNKYN